MADAISDDAEFLAAAARIDRHIDAMLAESAEMRAIMDRCIARCDRIIDLLDAAHRSIIDEIARLRRGD